MSGIRFCTPAIPGDRSTVMPYGPKSSSRRQWARNSRVTHLQISMSEHIGISAQVRCSPERLRGCEYGSIVGNQIGYASAELRFPVPGTYILGIPVRGFLLADTAYAQFSDEKLPPQKLKTYGFGAQYFIPFLGYPAQSVWIRDDGKWKPSFYITLHW